MVGLLDIGNRANEKTVNVRGARVSIPGVDARGVMALIGHYPVVEKAFGGKGAKAGDFTFETLIAMAPDLVTDIIVLGTGDREYNDETVAAANNLTLGEQADLLAAIVEVTMPSGVGPFIKTVRRMVAGLGLDTDAFTKEPDTK